MATRPSDFIGGPDRTGKEQPLPDGNAAGVGKLVTDGVELIVAAIKDACRTGPRPEAEKWIVK